MYYLHTKCNIFKCASSICEVKWLVINIIRVTE